MTETYQLRSHRFEKGRFFVLAKAGAATDFVDDIAARGDPNDILRMTIRSITAINEHGLAFAVTHGLARRISSRVLLLELKGRRTAWRVAAYLAERSEGHDSATVLLEEFKGHAGKSGRIPGGKIRALEARAAIAESIVEKERRDGNL